MNIYSIEFHVEALKEWKRLDRSIQAQFKKQLEKRILDPRVPSAKLHAGLDNFYKIKLRSVGYRLVYEIIEQRLVIIVIAIGRRDHNQTYVKAEKRK